MARQKIVTESEKKLLQLANKQKPALLLQGIHSTPLINDFDASYLG
jgi:hypothetical protein